MEELGGITDLDSLAFICGRRDKPKFIDLIPRWCLGKLILGAKCDTSTRAHQTRDITMTLTVSSAYT